MGQIVDTHLHYWQWPRDGEARAAAQSVARHSSAPVEGELSHRDVAATMDEAGVAHGIQVTRVLSAYDNSYSIEGSRQLPDRFRVCGRFDATAPDPERRLRAFFEDPSMVSLRLFWYSDDGWLRDRSLDGFWRAAQDLDVPVCVYAPRDPSGLEGVAARFPDLPLVVDHLGVDLFSPPGERFAHWDVVCRLAAYGNVHLKVSALPEATEERFPFPAAQRRVEEAYERFGADRLMWGSNHPLTTRLCTYGEAVDFIRVACDFLPADDKAKLLGGTAKRVFGLPW